MDPTQPTQTSSQPNITPAPVIPPQPQKSSLNKILLLLIIILIIITISLGGYILSSVSQKKLSPKITPQISPTESAKITVTITPTPTVIITDDPNNIDVGSVEADLKDIGTDVENLQ
jgi:flagellar basal body-associated protein FliL